MKAENYDHTLRSTPSEEQRMASNVNLGLKKLGTHGFPTAAFNSCSDVLREGVRIVDEREMRLQELEAALE
jgi:hypothetical protein